MANAADVASPYVLIVVGDTDPSLDHGNDHGPHQGVLIAGHGGSSGSRVPLGVVERSRFASPIVVISFQFAKCSMNRQ